MASLTAEAPDPKSFKSWEDAFKYPIPAVRRMEQQLRSDIAGNREKLRTLVGSSYRELLGTADSIVHMDEEMREAETYLGDISRKCNTRLLAKSKSSTAEITKQFSAKSMKFVFLYLFSNLT
jgi:conserved oligomeric Golgi complex subunit 1